MERLKQEQIKLEDPPLHGRHVPIATREILFCFLTQSSPLLIQKLSVNNILKR